MPSVTLSASSSMRCTSLAASVLNQECIHTRERERETERERHSEGGGGERGAMSGYVTLTLLYPGRIECKPHCVRCQSMAFNLHSFQVGGAVSLRMHVYWSVCRMVSIPPSGFPTGDSMLSTGACAPRLAQSGHRPALYCSDLGKHGLEGFPLLTAR
jgi:hypothetical protein